jgi:hypothetical protein
MKITAYKCPDTGKIFEDLKIYTSYRCDLLRARREKARMAARLAAWDSTLSAFRESTLRTQDIEEWIVANSDLLLARHVARMYANSKPPRKPFTLRFTEVKIKVQYRPHIVNSHYAPISGVRNWNRDTRLPLGYPGWAGQMQLTYEGTYPSFFTGVFRDTGIHLGSGSGTNDNKTYWSELALFEDDWTSMKPYQDLIKE